MKKLVVGLIILSLLTGCQSLNTKEQKGGAIGGAGGAVAGGVIGKKLGGDAGMIFGAILGGIGGWWAGSKIGEMLDEEDKKKHEQATQKALETGQAQSWDNPKTGTSGKIEVKPVEPEVTSTVTETPAVEPPPSSPETPQPQTVKKERECRTVSQTVTLQDGTIQTEDLTACKGPNGWEAV